MNQQGSSSDADFAIRRVLTGLCSLGLLVAWVLTLYFGEQDAADTVAPILMRLGLVTGALWLALPELRGIFKSMSGKGTLALLIALVVAATSKAGTVPLVILGGGLLVVFGARRAWQWLWEPLPTAASKAAAAASKSPKISAGKQKKSPGE